MNPHKAKQRIRSDPGALFVFMGFIGMLSSFLAYISMSSLKTSSKMEFNSKLDDKRGRLPQKHKTKHRLKTK